MAAPLSPVVIDALLLGPGERRRQLQDLPVLGDVWTALANSPAASPDLLVIPVWEKSAADVAHMLEEAGEAQNNADGKNSRSVAFLNGLVVATLTLGDIVDHVFPATRWWDRIEDQWRETQRPTAEKLRQWIRSELRQMFGRAARAVLGADLADGELQVPPMSADQQATRLAILLGMFLTAATQRKVEEEPSIPELPEVELEETILEIAKTLHSLGPPRVIDAAVEAIGRIMHTYDSPVRGLSAEESNGVIFQVTLNRKAEAALSESVPAIKGDAARSLFSISCSKLAWAVLDSGIDHTHPAFWDQKEVHKRLAASRGSRSSGDDPKLDWYPHRIKGAFDFRRIRAILGVKETELEDLASEIGQWSTEKPDEIKRLLKGIIDDRKRRLPVDWRKIQPLIELDIQEPPTAGPSDQAKRKSKVQPPDHPHGTHVAGIIGADWQKRNKVTRNMEAELQGVCPDISLYDCRVIGSDLGDSEFAVSAALQFIRFYNEQGGHPRINGVNMSLAIRHNVRNYACGRTPVCVEAEALVSSGVVVVAAAGNRGFQQYQLADHSTFEGFAASSITDPGNAEGVITVGSTHRAWPHTYGVSFFSSRGPTGDGRLKPDLLAPGEKITSCIPKGGRDEMDGTSMAAPHVSGAAALLMARHEELKGRPVRIKEILCSTATDLKRERSFQGHGMVDVLRAIQSL